MRFALITTVYNEGDNILAFLNSYKNQTTYASEFVIVDGGSIDNTVQVLSDFSINNPELSIKILIDKTCNKKHSIAPIAKGRNVAIKQTDCECIVVTDAGCILKKDWFQMIIEPFLKDNAEVVCGYYKVLIESEFDLKYADIFEPANDSFLPSSRSFAFKKECWIAVNGYPENSYTAEDTFFDLKLLKNGYKIHRAPKAIVYWKFAKNERDLRKKLFAYGKGEGRLLLYKRKFLFRVLNVFFPLYPFFYKKGFSTCYKFYFYQSMGYIYGFINRYSNI